MFIFTANEKEKEIVYLKLKKKNQWLKNQFVFIILLLVTSITNIRHYLPVGLNHFGSFVPAFNIAEEVMKFPEPADCCFLFELLFASAADSL